MRVVIVGAGVGGLTLALALHTRGLKPLVLERAAALEAAGAGVQLGPNATRILAALGLADALAAVSARPQFAEIRDGRSGSARLRVPLGDAAEARWGAPYLQVHRGDLQAVLLDAFTTRGAGELRLGAEVEHAGRGGLTLVGGERIEADLIVGCDGVRSRIRPSVVGPSAARAAGEIAWRALIPVAALATPLPGAVVWTWPQRHLVAYPVSGGRAVNLVAVTRGRLHGDGWSEPGDPDDLRRALLHAAPDAGALLDAVETVARWSLAELAPLPTWIGKGVALLGDAAHPMRPYLAQGAAMAIEDAECLARRLWDAGPLSMRLAAYEAERRPRATRVQAASRRNGAIFHLPQPLAALAFGAAGVVDAVHGGAMARLDWLYGYRPPA